MVEMGDMRYLKQGLILPPVVEVACFVVPNKEDYCSEQATSVCAFPNHFGKLWSQYYRQSEETFE